MSSSETVTSDGTDFFREAAFLRFSPRADLRDEMLGRPPPDFARTAVLALEIFERIDVSEVTGLAPPWGSPVDGTGATPCAAGALDFFAFFAIYFCFWSAKPLPAERRFASGNGTKAALR